MKVLTVKNPWAQLIIRGEKDVENRTWKTDYRGDLLIHASTQPVTFKEFVLLLPENCSGVFGTLYYYETCNRFNGCILGCVRLVDCVQNDKSVWAQQGLWHWKFENPVCFEKPVKAKGKLGVWEYDTNH
jgi:hypothetical protein